MLACCSLISLDMNWLVESLSPLTTKASNFPSVQALALLEGVLRMLMFH